MSEELIPKCLEAEQSAIGVALYSKRIASQLLAELSENDFFDQRNKALCLVLRKYLNDLDERNIPDEPVELAVLVDVIRSLGLNTKFPGLISYMAELAAFNSKSSISGYVEVIRKHSVLRKAIEQGSTAVQEAYALKDPVLIAAKLEEVAKEIMNAQSSGMLTFADAVADAEQNTNNGSRYRTGIPDLDAITKGGFPPGGLIVIAGRPGMGKTMLAVNLARSGLAKGQTVGFFSLEMTPAEIANRFIALEASYGNSKESIRYNLHIKSGRVSIADVASYLERLSLHDGGARLVVIDYLQLMETPGQARREEQISYITRSLKRLATEYEVPVLVLSQLNRECEKRNNPRPIMSDLRESGAIEQDADMILFLYRDEVYNENTKDKGIAELIVSKNRNGVAGLTIKMLFEPETSRFKNLSECYQGVPF